MTIELSRQELHDLAQGLYMIVNHIDNTQESDKSSADKMLADRLDVLFERVRKMKYSSDG